MSGKKYGIMPLRVEKNIFASESGPLLIYHNLCSTASGLFLYAYNVGIAVFNPRSTRAKPFFNLRTEKVTSVRHADGFKNLSEQSVTCVSTLSKAYAIGDKGLLATLSVSTEEFGVITSASLSVGPVSNSQANGIRMIVGTSEGKLLLSQNFVLSTEPAQIGVEKTVKEHTVAVTTVASTSDLAASEKSIVCATGDVIGSVLLWNSAYQNAVHIPSTYRDAVTDIAFLNKCLSIAVSYGSGKIRIFSSTGNCEVEVCGHAKWINAMAFSPTLEMLASAGEDGVVNVWRLTGEGQEPISFLSSHTITNGIPTGVAFHSTEKMLGVTYYGNEIIHLIKLD